MRPAALLWLPAFALLTLAARAGTVEDGIQALAAGRYADARAVLGPLAVAGDAAAAFQLGIAYDLDEADPDSARMAFDWYRRAAEAGLPSAAFNVAVMLDNGHGVERDASKAATWYARAAARGHQRAAYVLGQLYAAGEGVPRNTDLAAAWYRAAATLPLAARRLADMPPATADRAATDATDAIPPTPAAASPTNDAEVTGSAGPTEVALVWTAPQAPAHVRFYVEVLALDGSTPRRVFNATTDTSATIAKLDRPGQYAWRVYAASPASGHYAASDWARFAIRAPTPPGG